MLTNQHNTREQVVGARKLTLLAKQCDTERIPLAKRASPCRTSALNMGITPLVNPQLPDNGGGLLPGGDGLPPVHRRPCERLPLQS
jgi:hypothetical protein